ncbi:MAG TPA: hypothetical protein VN622_17320 [Clostridia bacterium]|nr:hypothetical protein [Clostridia bacterium]
MLLSRNLIRKSSLVLCGVFILVYISAKYHFFTSYFGTSSELYLREHSVYWAVMAALALAVWILESRYER